MTNDDILKAYIDKLDSDHARMRDELREEMRERNARIEKEITAMRTEAREREERADRRHAEWENRMGEVVAEIKEDMRETRQEAHESARWIRTNTVAVIIGVAGMVMAVLFGVPGWISLLS